MDWFGSINQYHEIAQVLTEQYNNYAGMSEDFPMLEASWVAERLEGAFDSSDLELFLEDDFARGLIMGQLRTIYTYEEVINSPDDDESDDAQD